MKKIVNPFVIILLLLLLAGCSPALYNAASVGDMETVKMLLDRSADVNEKGGGGLLNDSNALDAASSNGHLNVVTLLLNRGADIDQPTGTMGWTALSSAAWKGHTDIIKLLIDRGADINKAIAALDRGVGTQNAIELLKEQRRERATVNAAMARLQAEISSTPAAIKSDIDEIPPTNVKPNKNAYAIVIGIENYRQKLPRVDFATQDARLVADYVMKTMGYPEENVITLLNDHASNVDLAKYFEKWLVNNVEKDDTVFVYYSGHGAPNTRTGDAYLVPYDGDPSFIDQTGYSLKRMYGALGKLPAKEIIVALDSCFSGAGGRSVLAEGARPLVMNLQSSVALPKNITVIAAAAGDQISSTYKDKGHGLFTYFLLKGIRNEDIVNPDGSLDISNLFSYIKPRVERIARKKYNNEQTPQLIVPDSL